MDREVDFRRWRNRLWRGGIEKKGTLPETTNDVTTWLTIKPDNIWDKLPTNWCRISEPSTVRI